MSEIDKTPTRGIYPMISMAEYQSWPMMNNSTLGYARLSMAHLKAALDRRIFKDTPALRFGAAMHTRLLEPHLYPERHSVAGPCNAIVKSGENKGRHCGAQGSLSAKLDDQWVWYCRRHAPAEAIEPASVITQSEHDGIEEIYKTVMGHPVVQWLREKGGAEVSIVTELDGVQCKARVDKLITPKDAPPIILDLKKVRMGCARPTEFERSINLYHYEEQAAFYIDAVCAETGAGHCDFIFVAIEDEYPHGISLMQLDIEAIEIGRAAYRANLARYKRAREEDKWPGYGQQVTTVSLPAWRLKQELRNQ